MKAIVKAALACVAMTGVSAMAQESQTLQPQVVEQKTAAPAAGGGDVTACTNGKNKRTLHLSTSKGCEVQYKKETEIPGHSQVLWSAKNDPSYCSPKLTAFVEKLQGMGWTCAKQ